MPIGKYRGETVARLLNIGSAGEVSEGRERPPMCHPRIVSIVLAFWLLVATGSNVTASNIVEKKFPFPSPLQWKQGKAEISLIALAWGPANSPEMISRGREKQPGKAGRGRENATAGRSAGILLGSFLCNRPQVPSRSAGICLFIHRGSRVCVETRFSWLEIKRDHDPLQILLFRSLPNMFM